jgi:hypothetical protein
MSKKVITETSDDEPKEDIKVITAKSSKSNQKHDKIPIVKGIK